MLIGLYHSLSSIEFERRPLRYHIPLTQSSMTLVLDKIRSLVVDLYAHNPIALLLVSAVVFTAVVHAIRSLISAQRDRAFAASHGCKPARFVVPKSTDLWLSFKAIAKSTYLESQI